MTDYTNGKFLDRKQAPMCLHALGQPLVEALWKEGKAIREAARDLLAHHLVKELDDRSDTLQPRLEALRKLVQD